MAKARKMLSDLNAPYIQSLMRLIETQSKSTLAHWAVDYAELVILPLWSNPKLSITAVKCLWVMMRLYLYSTHKKIIA